MRVSTGEQSEELQVRALREAGVHPDNIHVDKGVSGAAKVMPAREMALRQCRSGDTLVVWQLDRLSRSTFDMLSTLRELEGRKIGMRSLNESLDTSGPAGVFMVHVVAAYAQYEREIAQERTIAGIEHAKARGVKFGQPTKMTPVVRNKVDKWLYDGWSVPRIAKKLGLAESTIRKHWKAEGIARARSRKKRRG